MLWRKKWTLQYCVGKNQEKWIGSNNLLFLVENFAKTLKFRDYIFFLKIQRTFKHFQISVLWVKLLRITRYVGTWRSFIKLPGLNNLLSSYWINLFVLVLSKAYFLSNLLSHVPFQSFIIIYKDNKVSFIARNNLNYESFIWSAQIFWGKCELNDTSRYFYGTRSKTNCMICKFIIESLGI